ncbi:MAG TPA: hypothetical protein VLX44_02465 [Xanthobacteraceae bacterium]|nr:hypothetical protein [Xanthobacteraceae bacterium]
MMHLIGCGDERDTAVMTSSTCGLFRASMAVRHDHSGKPLSEKNSARVKKWQPQSAVVAGAPADRLARR